MGCRFKMLFLALEKITLSTGNLDGIQLYTLSVGNLDGIQ